MKNFVLFLGLFVFLSLPAVFARQNAKKKTVVVQFPDSSGRRLASNVESPHFDHCEPALRWRYKCNEDRGLCKKDRQETYLRCKDL